MKCCRDIINTFPKNLSTGLIKKEKRDKKINTIYDNIGFFYQCCYDIFFSHHLTVSGLNTLVLVTWLRYSLVQLWVDSSLIVGFENDS